MRRIARFDVCDMSLAEDEVDRLLNQKEHLTGHPEDIYHSSDDHSSEFYDDDEDHDHDQPVYSNEDDDDDTNNHLTNAMHGRKSTYHIPTAVFDANTGPKGVISDAQSFERAKKRSFRRTIMGATGWDFSSASRSPRGSPPYSHGRGTGVEHALSDDDEDFMRRWREVRMAELVAGRRKVGPSKRRWGTVEVVDAAGYLDAIEQVMAGTVVVVCIYDPEVRTVLIYSPFARVISGNILSLEASHIYMLTLLARPLVN